MPFPVRISGSHGGLFAEKGVPSKRSIHQVPKSAPFLSRSFAREATVKGNVMPHELVAKAWEASQADPKEALRIASFHVCISVNRC